MWQFKMWQNKVTAMLILFIVNHPPIAKQIHYWPAYTFAWPFVSHCRRNNLLKMSVFSLECRNTTNSYNMSGKSHGGKGGGKSGKGELNFLWHDCFDVCGCSWRRYRFPGAINEICQSWLAGKAWSNRSTFSRIYLTWLAAFSESIVFVYFFA